MLAFQLATFALCLVTLSKGQDAKYCGLRVKSTEIFANTPPNFDYKVMIASTDLNVADSIINKDPIISSQMPSKNGVFVTPSQIIDPFFCKNQFLESGDINGDGRDDLICRDSITGEITVRMRTVTGYERSEIFADTQPEFKCSPDGDMRIGDFDGNGADDFLCILQNAAGTERGSYTIYFNSGCNNKRQKESFHHNHERHRSKSFNQPARSNQFANGPSSPDYLGCNPNLPQKQRQTGTLPCTNIDEEIVIGDIDGDYKDDIVCWNAITGAISYHLSKPTSFDAVFSKEEMTAIQCQAGTHWLMVSDVDADSDGDLICVGQLPGSPGNLPRVSFYTPNGFLAMEAFYDDCGAAEFCSDATAFFAGVFVGDFNNDNRADVLCRYTSFGSSEIKSEIVFSEPR